MLSFPFVHPVLWSLEPVFWHHSLTVWNVGPTAYFTVLLVMSICLFFGQPLLTSFNSNGWCILPTLISAHLAVLWSASSNTIHFQCMVYTAYSTVLLVMSFRLFFGQPHHILTSFISSERVACAGLHVIWSFGLYICRWNSSTIHHFLMLLFPWCTGFIHDEHWSVLAATPLLQTPHGHAPKLWHYSCTASTNHQRCRPSIKGKSMFVI